MKKLLTLLAVLFASATMAHAQFGIIGGINISGTQINTDNIWENAKNVTMYHVGVAYQFDLALGFTVQPTLTYDVKGANLSTVSSLGDVKMDTKSGYLELGAALQWGPDLIVARPFVMVQPFIGYQVTASDSSSANALNLVTLTSADYDAAINNAKNKLEYGVGIGAGVEFLKRLQLTVQYFKNMGGLYNNDGSSDAKAIWESVKDIQSYNGVKVTLGIFF